MKAFPSVVQYFPDDTNYHDEQGMTLRDYFAAKAMQGLVAASGDGATNVSYSDDVVAKSAYELADMMLKVRGQ